MLNLRLFVWKLRRRWRLSPLPCFMCDGGRVKLRVVDFPDDPQIVVYCLNCGHHGSERQSLRAAIRKWNYYARWYTKNKFTQPEGDHK